MAPISRRMFLVGSVAVVLTACSSDDSSSPTTLTASTDAAPTDPTEAATTPTDAATTSTAATTTTAPATTTTATVLTPETLSAVDLSGEPFTLGVASGDPDATSVVLWTRLAPDALHGGGMPTDHFEVRWELSADDSFETLLAVGDAVAEAAHGHSVHAVATPPEPSTDAFFYRFRIGDFTSPTGRTRIAPTGAVDSTTFVSASCQNYEDGFYAAHRDIAEMQPDFLVWLGDYIYEGGTSPVGTDGSVRDHGTEEPKDLAAYRDRYALYKLDEHLQAAHAICPWFVIWDDHEVENNYAGTTPQDAADTAAFAARRQDAYKAWWEHTPVRLDPPPDTGEYRIYRTAQWGDLIGMVLLDTRQYRTDQACGDVTFDLDPPCAETFDDDRTLTGADQEAWMFEHIAHVGTQDTTWNVIAQQIVMADVTLNMAVLNYDQWDGYPKARQRLLRHLADNAVPNAIVLSGDIHLAGVATLSPTEPGTTTPVAIEFVDTSISSGGLIPAEFTDVVKSFADIVDVELYHRGYTLHTVTPTGWTATYRTVDTASDPDSPVSTYKTFVVDAGTTAVREQA